MSLLRVDEVKRQELRKGGTFVFKVIVVFDGRISVTFGPDYSRFNKGYFVEWSRGDILKERLHDRDQLWIPDVWYQKIMETVGAIFTENKRDGRGNIPQKKSKDSG